MRLLLLLAFSAIFTAAPAQEIIRSIVTQPIDPTAQAKADAVVQLLREANLLLSEKKTDDAIVKVNAALAQNPRSLDAYVLLGAIHSEQKAWDKAQSDFENAHLINPHSLVVEFNLSEIKFSQKLYDAARPGFVQLESDKVTDIGDLAVYKAFLCDLFGGHEDAADKDLAAINEVGSGASYYFSNAAWDLFHRKFDDAQDWLRSATAIYSNQKSGFYLSSLYQLGYLPITAPK
jgi:tetratricopeptide (TPR) repeat protein